MSLAPWSGGESTGSRIGGQTDRQEDYLSSRGVGMPARLDCWSGVGGGEGTETAVTVRTPAGCASRVSPGAGVAQPRLSLSRLATGPGTGIGRL